MSLRARSIALLALLVGVLAVVAAGCGGDDSSSSGGSAGGNGGKKMYKIGVSNTLVGNGWREEMICSVKAQALASGQVSEVLVHNVNGDASAQIQGIRNLISSGANAIVINPADRTALDPVIKEADRRGIVVVAVDQAVDAPEAYVVTNDQVAYGKLGAQYLVDALGGKGNIVEMRGISGVPADDDRHQGFTEVMKANPGIGRAEALRRAMLALMGDSSSPLNPHPAVWAPFVVVGEGGAEHSAPRLVSEPTRVRDGNLRPPQ